MPAFEYIALDTSGKEQKGILEADGLRQVRQLLRDRGLVPLTVASSARRGEKRSFLREWFTPSISARDLALLTRQLATLIGAALPVEEALLAVSRQSESRTIETMLLAVRSKVMEGYSLADSLADYPNAFPNLYRAAVAAGEAAGHLDLIMRRLAEFTESRYASRQKVLQAMVYPIILFVLTIAIVGFLLGYVVPDIVKVFEDTDQALPALTAGLIGLSEFVRAYGLYLLFALVIAAVGVSQLLKNPAVRLRFDRRLLYIPLVSKLSRGFNSAQFTSTLAILSGSGVPLVDAMRISGQVLSNSWLRERVSAATVKVSEGSSLKSALEQGGYFPPLMLHMIGSGESSGELDEMLARTSEHLQQDVEMLTSIMLSLFGPIMLVLMGGVVLTIVIAILLPIMNLNQLAF